MPSSRGSSLLYTADLILIMNCLKHTEKYRENNLWKLKRKVNSIGLSKGEGSAGVRRGENRRKNSDKNKEGELNKLPYFSTSQKQQKREP